MCLLRRTKAYPLGLPEHQDNPELKLANKIVNNMVNAIKIIGKEMKCVSVENPRGSTLWHHPDLLALMDQVGIDGKTMLRITKIDV